MIVSDTPSAAAHRIDARLLKPLAITSQNVRIGDSVVRGYYCHQFDEVFDRYLSGNRLSNRYNATNADDTGTSDLFQSATADPDVALQKSQKSNNDGLCSGVALRKTGNGHVEEFGLSERTIDEIAEWVRAFASHHVGEPDADAQLVQALRERLRNKYDVRSEDLDAEAARVMARAFEPL
jgi:hypothetical protein